MPNFSVVLICKNEQNTLPRLLDSLKDFRGRNGEIVICDTGSTDKTVEIAKSYGCVVHEAGDKFISVISNETAKKVNKKFLVGEEAPLVKGGSKLFDFAAARNHVTSLASNDFVFTLDADEVYSRFDIDRIDNLINEGYEQFEYHFIFSHGAGGAPAIQFTQSKAFDRRKLKWDGIVHEILVPVSGASKRLYLDGSICLLEHWQECNKEHRGNYLTGLAMDCYQHPNNDRNSHYAAREMMYSGRNRSALKEFERHAAMNAWPAERAQSMTYMGDILGQLGKPDAQAGMYFNAFHVDSGRRQPLLRLADFYLRNKNYQSAIAFASAALTIPMNEYYANEKAEYEDIPHRIIYIASGWIGNISAAQDHLLKCLEYQPYHPEYLRDTKFYFEYPDQGIEGWMMFNELQWLYNTAKTMNSVVEIGSFAGRSSHALLSGCKGDVLCIDTWEGSDDVKDQTKDISQQRDIFAVFEHNTKSFGNRKVLRKRSIEAAKEIPDGSVDFVFIDAGHDYESVVADIRAWKGKATKMICGHDWLGGTWDSVIAAVRDELGEPDGVCGTIWYFDLTKRGRKRSLLDEFTDKLNNRENFSFVKLGDGEELCMRGMRGANCDGHQYSPELGRMLRESFAYLKARKDTVVTDYHNQYEVNILLHRNDSAKNKLRDFYLAIKNSDRDKYYVAPERLALVADFLGATHIKVPLVNAFESYGEIYNALPSDNAVIMFSSGMPSKAMIGKLLQNGCNLTCLDIGSAWDSLITPTRTNQMTKEEIENLYCDVQKISIVLPTLGRKDGLKKCIESIHSLDYPKDLIELIVIEDSPRKGVPLRMAEGVEKSTGEFIVFAANDMLFHKDCLMNAVKDYFRTGKRLVSFNEGALLADSGNICTHFMIKRDLIAEIGGEVFDTKFNHCGVDNLLWAKCSKINEAYHSETARITHNHFSKGFPMDEVNETGWSKVEKDREILRKELEKV